MLFTSPTFIFVFLPLVLLFYYLSPTKLKNLTLLLFSLLFYAWGEVFYVILMMLSIMVNYIIGRLIYHPSTNSILIMVFGITLNLLPLLFFKYITFFASELGFGLKTDIHLPLGISFFTFQAISYLIDVYRKETQAEKSLVKIGLYITLFPQLIAGPIVRFKTICDQISFRNHSQEKFISGIERFVFGLSKKLLIANPLGFVADEIYALPTDQIDSGLAWVAAISYTLQIYFDFSAYSDMAIGLGKMFGFKILENFNYPYIAQSIQEFWRRWHISLSQWFKDYLYIPLGGNRNGNVRTYINLIIVFVLCGLWHGASWSFIVWGLYHGLFLVLEKLGLKRIIQSAPKLLRHCYMLLVVIFGWVFFRVENIGDALTIQGKMLQLQDSGMVFYNHHYFTSPLFYIALCLGILLSSSIAKPLVFINHHSLTAGKMVLRNLLIAMLLVLNFAVISASTYNPFIYFRF
jgi:alginate O-acetyltransferase complex protein AlgI